LSYEGYPVSAIWKRVNVHPDNVRKWIRRFNKYGINGIIEKKKTGRKPIINKEVEQKIISIFNTKPKELGIPFNTWSLRKLQAYLIKNIVKDISHVEVRRVLLSEELNYRRARQELESEDPKYEAKMARIKRLLKKPNCIVLFEDEKTIVAKRYPGHEWCFKSAVIKKNQKIKGKAVMFAIYNHNSHEHKIYRKYFNRLTKDNFRKFLDYIDKLFDEDVYMILDNHRSHWLGKKYKRIKLVFLPTHSPKLNQMDTQFSVIQREVLNNSKFRSIGEVEKKIDSWIRSFNSKNN
jgi:transposase